MNARWVRITTPPSALPYAINTAPQQTLEAWAAVTDDDEIIGQVQGADQMWSAQATLPTQNRAQIGGGNYGSFISEAGAKRRVEQWLAPAYTFPQASANTSWAYKA